MTYKLAFGLIMAASVASATIITVPGVNGTHDTSSSSEFSLTGVAQFVNPNDTSAAGSVVNYYAGTMHADDPSLANGFLMSFAQNNDYKSFSIGKYEWGNNWAYWFNGANSGGGASVGTALGSDLDFAVKVENNDWNAATVSLFIGANATAATEGTADFTINVTASDFSKIIFGPTQGASGSVTVSNFAAGDQWVAIPEPATMGMLAIFGGGILFIRRIFLV